jgi:TolB-like protein
VNATIDRLREALRGRYDLERELGSGGMATVWLARDVRHERKVALKLLRPDVASTLGGERFLREIRLAAGLQHPHIVPLYDSGEAAGVLYYVMPHLEGETLRQRLQRDTQMPVAEALLIAREVCDALHYAHQQDLVHRDIKPDNLLLVNGHALVLDFGIARAVSEAGGLTLTETGIAVGTPAHMSPEQAAADPRVDGRADIYALGCVLYEMFAGTPPFTGPTAQAIMARHSADPVPSVRTLRPVVSPALEATLTKALAKLPADRHATAREFARSLDASMIPGVPDGSTRRRLIPYVAVPVAAAGVLLWIFASGGGTAEGRDAASASIAVAPLRNLGDSSDVLFAEGLAADVTSELARIRGLAPRPFESVLREFANESDPEKLGERLAVDYVLTGSFQRVGERFKVRVELLHVPDGALVWAGNSFDGSTADLFAMQDSISRQLVAQLQGKLKAEGLPLGVAQGRRDPEAYRLYHEAKRLLASTSTNRTIAESASRLLEQAVERDSTFADAWATLALAYDWLAQFSGRAPMEIVSKARSAAERAVAIDPGNADGGTYLARHKLNFEFDVEGYDASMRRVLQNNPGSALAHATYGQQLRLFADLDSSLAQIRRAETLDPTSAFTVSNKADHLLAARRLDEATVEARRALSMDSTQWLAHLVLGVVSERRGDDVGAARAFSQAQRAMGEDVPWMLAYCAYYYARAGWLREAREVMRKLTERERSGEYVQPVFIAMAKLGLGDVSGALVELEESERARDRDFFWKILMGEFEELRDQPRYEAILVRTGAARFLRQPSPVTHTPLHRKALR